MPLLSIDVGTKNLALCALRPGATPEDSVVERWALLDVSRGSAGRGGPTAAALIEALRPVVDGWDFDRVLVERQPSANPRMRRVEAMLDMFFAVHARPVTPVMPARKLAFAATTRWWPGERPGRWTYAARKRLSTRTAVAWLRGTDQSAAARGAFAACAKKDDLADALLQALAHAHGGQTLRECRAFGRDMRRAAEERAPPTPTPATRDERKEKRIVARRPTARQAASGDFSKSNVKFLVRGMRDVAAGIAADPALAAAVDRLFGSVDRCVAELCAA